MKGSTRFGAALATIGLIAGTLVLAQASPAHANLSTPVTALFIDEDEGAPLQYDDPHQHLFSNITTSYCHCTPFHYDAVNFNVPGTQFTVGFATASDQVMGVGTYEGATSSQNYANPSLYVRGSYVCYGTGRFIVDDILWGSDGSLVRFSARFSMACSAGNVFGAASFNSTADFRSTSNASVLPFTATRVGHTSDALTETITNNGPSALTVSGAAVAGTNATDFHITSSTCSGSIPSGGSCGIGVTFSPTADGTRTAYLQFFDELAPVGGPPRSILLTGDVLRPPSWAPLDFILYNHDNVISDPVVTTSGSSMIAYGINDSFTINFWTAAHGVWGPVGFRSGYVDSVPEPVTTNDGDYVFVLDQYDSLEYSAPADPNIFMPLGGTLISTPESAVDSTGLYVFGVGTDHALWYRRLSGGAWSSWKSLGGYLTTDVAAAVDSTGLYVFGRGGDMAMWYQRFNAGSSTGWTTMGGAITSFPSAVVTPSGIDVVARGADLAIWHRRATGSPNGWSSLGGYLISAPSATVDRGELYVFGVGGDNAMWSTRATSSPKVWASLGGYVVSNPASVAEPSGGGVWVFGLGQDSHMWSYPL
jgi:hypothetical protein